METANHEYYVSLEVAKLLKEAGFDWEIMSFYTNDITEGCESEYELRLVKFDNWNGKNKSWCDLVSCPTLDIAQRWLRVVKGIYIGINEIENKRAVTNSDGWTFHYEYGKPTFDCDIKDERCEDMCTLYDSFDTYEEAQEAGIKKALEIILNKGK